MIASLSECCLRGRTPPCHRSVTQFRNQEDTGGLERTRRARRLSTGGHARNRRDTEGHTVVPVRDREAPGSNPGPPTPGPRPTSEFCVRQSRALQSRRQKKTVDQKRLGAYKLRTSCGTLLNSYAAWALRRLSCMALPFCSRWS